MKLDPKKYSSEGPQTLLVATDDKYKELVGRLNQKRFYRSVLNYVGWVSPFNFIIKPIILLSNISSEYDILSYLDQDEIPIPHIDPIEAKSLGYSFRNGAAINGSIYIRHIVEPMSYILPAEYNSVIAKDKFAAFLDATSVLGAKKVVFETKIKDNQSTNINANMDAFENNILGINFSEFNEHQKAGKAERTFGKPDNLNFSESNLPSSVFPWMEEDRILNTAIYARLNSNIENEQISLVFGGQNESQVHAAIALKELGLEIGGKRSSGSTQKLDFSIEYWPKN